ncbi:MAG: methyltransferase domain-containing protein [Candidatus Paceibacterota bacterium]
MTDPAHNCEQLGLQPGQHVADLGSGAGYYTIELAKRVGTEGKVFAIDVRKDLLEKVKSAARDEGFENVEVAWGNIEVENGTRLRSDSIDVVIIANTLFQIEDQAGLARETVRILKPKGTLLVVDWTGSHGGIGPVEEQVVPEEKARELFELAGLEFANSISTGEHHYGFIMENRT